MRRHSKASGKSAKAQQRRTLKRRNTAKAVIRRSSSADSQDTKVAVLTRERDEALEQLAATSGILGVIRRSPTNAQPVFDAICGSASRLCEEVFSVVWRYDGNLLQVSIL